MTRSSSGERSRCSERAAWDPDFIERSPMLQPLREVAAPLRSSLRWPGRAEIEQLLDDRCIETASGKPLRLVASDTTGDDYERRIYVCGEMPYLERDWHDLFNVLAWLAYPRTKAALNSAHARELRCALGHTAMQAPPPRRSRARDALTLFDESGAIVISSNPQLLDDLRAFRWKRLFWEQRERVLAAVHVYTFGHALFEKALHPYLGMTAQALLLNVSGEVLTASPARQLALIDALTAEKMDVLASPQMLAPLPLLGVPGWWPENQNEGFYDNDRYFRPGRTSR